MELKYIEELISQGENHRLEFKTSTAKLKNIFSTLCGFLNDTGGIVLIGVKDNGQWIGQQVADKTQLEISNEISKIEPPASIDINYINISSDKYIIMMTANPNPSSIPYVYDGRPYWRVESSTKIMPQQRYHELLMARANFLDVWEIQPAFNINMKDLDHQEIIKTIHESVQRGRLHANLMTQDPLEALIRLKLIVNGKISNAAVILFCHDPLPQYAHCVLKLFRFKSIDKSELLDSKHIHGHAFHLLEEAESFLLRNIAIKSEFTPGKMARKDIPEYPPRAIREAIVNAICHRDYTIQGGAISLMMHSDRLEVISHGKLPIGLTTDILRKTHESLPRNERITSVMYRRGIIESAGAGTQEMIKECKLINSPEPEYTERGNTFVVTFRKSSAPPLNNHISDRQKEILRIMSSLNTNCSVTEIIDLMQQPPTDRTLRNDLLKLEQQGFVKKIGHNRGTLWQLEITESE